MTDTFKNKYERLYNDLVTTGTGKMKCFGSSMLPILKSGSKCTYIKQDEYEIGDIVFCKVKGRWIDGHLVTQKSDKRGYMIANNHGHQNGWTRQVFGRIVKAEDSSDEVRYFNWEE